jgi:hypothetical protein
MFEKSRDDARSTDDLLYAVDPAVRREATGMILYKYLPPIRVDVLERNLVRYTPPGAFNDPFETSPHISGLMATHALAQTASEVLSQARNEIWAQLPDATKSGLKRDDFDRLVGVADVTNAAAGLLPTFRTQMTARVNERIGILSLSSRRDSLLMWAHYSAAHAGFVIGLDATHRTFSRPPFRVGEASRLRKVSYSTERPSRTLTELSPSELLFTKSQEWAYEEEWRALELLNDAAETKAGTPWSIHLFELPAACIREVILGCRVTTDTDARIQSVLAQDRYRGVRLFRADVDDRHFGLSMTPSTRGDQGAGH